MKLISFLVIILFVSCSRQIDEKKLTQDILKEFRTSEQGWNDGDIDTYMKVYHNSEKLLFVGLKSASYGWQKVRDNYKAKYDTKDKMGQLTFTEVDVTILSEKSALVFGRWTLKRKMDQPTGLFTLVFKKFDQGWRIIHDHTP